jgi:hypothetical protein
VNREAGSDRGSGRLLPRLLRFLAVAIVLLAALDPAVPSGREGERLVAVLPVSEAEPHLPWVDEVAGHLDRAFSVTRAPWPGVDATVFVGYHLPDEIRYGMVAGGGPVFLVRPPDRHEVRSARILGVEAPRRVPEGSRVPVRAWLELGGAGTVPPMRATLRSGGVLLADTTVREEDLARWGSTGRLELEVASPGVGLLPLRLELAPEGLPEERPRGAGRTEFTAGAGADLRVADLLVEVESRRWQVLFFEARPSWMTTFVRRALADDPRFELHSRTVTAPGLATRVGEAPPGLLDAGLLHAYDLVVVGAPEALDEAAVDALESFLRDRGGTVALLPDREASGSHDRLTGVTGWLRGGGPEPEPLVPEGFPGHRPTLEVRSWIAPSPIPLVAVPVARSLGGHPVIWQRPVGKGRLVVSGALDSWQFRDPETTGFQAFWSTLLGEGADRAPRPVELTWAVVPTGQGGGGGAGSGVVAPGDLLRFELTVRTPLPRGDGVEVRARMEVEGVKPGDPPPHDIPLWPTAHPGRFEGWVRAPQLEGLHLLRVDLRPTGAAGVPGAGQGMTAPDGWDETVRLPLKVSAEAGAHRPDDPELLVAWAGTRGGGVLEAGDPSTLVDGIRHAVGNPAPRDPGHPFRSPWWILPLALALAGEWTWRRRRGLA